MESFLRVFFFLFVCFFHADIVMSAWMWLYGTILWYIIFRCFRTASEFRTYIRSKWITCLLYYFASIPYDRRYGWDRCNIDSISLNIEHWTIAGSVDVGPVVRSAVTMVTYNSRHGAGDSALPGVTGCHGDCVCGVPTDTLVYRTVSLVIHRI